MDVGMDVSMEVSGCVTIISLVDLRVAHAAEWW